MNARDPDLNEARQLLTEWMQWWDETNDAPVKMPNGLHVRTALFIIEADLLKNA